MIHLYDWIADLMQTSKTIQSVETSVEESKELVDVADGLWAPTLGSKLSYGYQDRQNGEGRSDTVLHPRNLELSLTQKLWDFGESDARVEAAELNLQTARVGAEATRQGITMLGVASYLELIRAHKLLRFARASVDNIKRQTDLEDARVERGSGLSSDVLQAKGKLSGAEGRRVTAEGTLKYATNRFLAVFNSLPPDIDMLQEPPPPADLLPATVEDAVDISVKENPQLHLRALRANLADAGVDRTRASGLFPELNLIADHNNAIDAGGTRGNTTSSGVRVEMTYSWNLAATAIDSLRAAKHSSSAEHLNYADARDQIEEVVRTTWDRLETERERTEHLINEANWESEFLELARKERSLGNRTIEDVLTAEVDLIFATSDATSAQIVASIAVYELLAVMGRLSLDTIPKSDRTASLGN
ncbi:MAG: TolC family protein [Rhodospirillales bacterium]